VRKRAGERGELSSSQKDKAVFAQDAFRILTFSEPNTHAPALSFRVAQMKLKKERCFAALKTSSGRLDFLGFVLLAILGTPL